jgi:HD superfamily phosphohydrolase
MNTFSLGIMYLCDAYKAKMVTALNKFLTKSQASEKTKDVFIAAMLHDFRNPLNSKI